MRKVPKTITDAVMRAIERIEAEELSELELDVKLYSIRKVEVLTGLSRATLLAFRDEGLIEFTHRFGERMIKISHRELVRFVDAHRVKRQGSRVAS